MSRVQDLDRLYKMLERIRTKLGGCRLLRDCTARTGWPLRGVYFFFEDGELREDGKTPRVVRVGTHALTTTSKTTLWNRLSQHRGTPGGSTPGGGNHRGSIFRLHVGTALQKRNAYSEAEAHLWGEGQTAAASVRTAEYRLERDVSSTIGAMPFLWLEVPDAPGPGSLRTAIESNAIGLLSNYGRPSLDPSSAGWLGRAADRPQISGSGLWNVRMVERSYDAAFLDFFERLLGD